MGALFMEITNLTCENDIWHSYEFAKWVDRQSSVDIGCGVANTICYEGIGGTSSGKSFSLGSENNEDATGSSSGLGGGSGGGNLDVMEKIMGAAKNYASSSFPRTSLVFGTLMQVMKVDMYVLLCGMLIGLVMSSMDEKMIGGGNNGDAVVGGGRSGIVLGGGEL